jgi:multicomponent Na+:H+ antiporter subunit D
LTWIPPLLVAVPLLTAAVVAGSEHLLSWRARDALGIAAAAVTLALALTLMLETERRDVIHWFSGWRPRGGVAIGIDFAIGPLGAAMAALTAGVVLVALLFSWSYLEEATRLYETLVLLCCGAICGFVQSGDIFNMFVWLELMGAAAFALTGFEVRDLGPLQGAVNFAITNTIAGFFVLIGIGLVYARTGALNLAQIGSSLASARPDALVVLAFTLVVCGFLCKAAVVPFHLWLADAYAVAPAPVCAIFAAVMTDVGLFGVARVYWTSFHAALAVHGVVVGDVLLALGVAGALLGGAMAFLQRHLKRMLAYSVICHIGIMLAGVGLLSSRGLAGAADLLLAHGLLTAGLFLLTGVVLAWLRSVDELELHGKGRGRRWLAVLWFGAAVGLAGPPYVGVFLGHSLIDDAASAAGRPWAPPLLWAAGALASAALVRAGARVFAGAGRATDPLLSPEASDRPPARGALLPLLGGTAAVTVCLGLVVSLVPGLAQRTEQAADRFRDQEATVAFVLRGRAPAPPARPPFALAHATGETLGYSIGATVLALALAGAGLYRQRFPRHLRDAGGRALGPPVELLRTLHTGVVGDYVMWLTVGTALVGSVWVLTLR